MQTNFSAEHLTTPAMRNSETILRSCVHCGFCTATCPTYVLLGDELDSPRGRIYLIKQMLEGGKPATPQIVKHIDRCLSCLSCMSTCPSGVHYMHLVDHARAYIADTYRRPLADRALRALLGAVLPYPDRFRLALLAAAIGQPFKPLLTRLPHVGGRLAAMLDLAPRHLPNKQPFEGRVRRPDGPRRKRVALLAGCAQPVLDPGINEATARLLNRAGVEVVFPKGEGCCGALVHHMGAEQPSRAFARRNIEAWTRELDGEGLDAIVITASGCGTTIKDYGFMFRDDPVWAERAARVSALARDITEVLAELGLPSPTRATGDVVAYHSACSMQHGQKIVDVPKTLLKQAGFVVKDVPEGHLCCGSAGVYNILQPDIAGQLRARKVVNIEKTRPAIVATGNIGCMTQIGKGFADRGSAIPVVHTVELLDWATGGPMPAKLEEAGFVWRPEREPERAAAE